MLNSTRNRLSELQVKYRMETNRSTHELTELETTLRDSAATEAHFKASASHAGATFDSFHKLVAHTVVSLRRAVVTAKAHSVSTVTVSKDTVANVRRVLAAKTSEKSHK